MSNTILAIDIGSRKICAAIAESRSNEPRIIGFGTHKSQGVKKGAIVNIELASQAIRSAASDAIRMAGIDTPTKAIVSISGTHTKSINSFGVVSIANSEITIKEIGRSLETALHHTGLPPEYDIIHVLPYRFRLDDQDYIEDPDGMTGSKLEVSVHIIAAKKSSIDNIKKTIKLAGFEVENIVLTSYASSIGTLLEDEKELGAICIDMGATTSEMVVYLDKSIRYNHFLSVGSHHITNDIAAAIHAPISASEKIKIQYADPIQYTDEPQGSGELEVPSIGSNSKHSVPLNAIQSVVCSRLSETFDYLYHGFILSGLEKQISTLVLTGGMTKLTNIDKVAQQFFNFPIRIAKPIPIDSVLPEQIQDECNATIIGLILYGMGKHTNYERDSQKELRCRKARNFQNPLSAESNNFSHTDLRNLNANYEKEEQRPEKPVIIAHPSQKQDGAFMRKLKEIASRIF